MASTSTRTRKPETAPEQTDAAPVETDEKTETVQEAATDTAQNSEEKAEETPKSPWDDLEEPTLVEYTRNGVAAGKDYEKETPEIIKRGLQKSFDLYLEAVIKAKETGDDKRVMPVWLTQKTKSKEMATEFMKLAKEYGRFREWTVRAGTVPGNESTVRYCAKVKETRTRAR